MTINPAIPYWTPKSPAGTDGHLRECFVALGNRRQRTILHALVQYGRSLSRADLVGRLLALEGEPTGSPAEASVEISLTHVDLPRLAAAGLVATSDESSTVRLLEHPLLADPHIERLLALDETWDDQIRAMAVERHRLICGILDNHPNGLSQDRLAALVAAHESSRITHDFFALRPTDGPPIPDTTLAPTVVPTHSPDPAVTERIVDALYHTHLPTLEAAGLVVYDPEAGTAIARVAGSDTAWQSAEIPPQRKTDQYPSDCGVDGVGVRLVVSPDGYVDDAYAYVTDESTIRTVAVPIHTPMTDNVRQSETVPTDEPRESTAPSPNREQWLIDCWLRDNVAS